MLIRVEKQKSNQQGNKSKKHVKKGYVLVAPLKADFKEGVSRKFKTTAPGDVNNALTFVFCKRRKHQAH